MNPFDQPAEPIGFADGPPELTPDEFERFKARWRAQHDGAAMHRVYILNGTVGNILAKNITARSQFITSLCCQAPVLQVHDWAPEVFRVLCSRCYREAGSPGREDVDMAQLVAP